MEDKLKNDWKTIQEMLSRNPIEIKNISRKIGSLVSLQRRYKFFYMFAFIYGIIVFPLLIRSSEISDFFSRPIDVCFIIFFILCGILDLYLWSRIRKIDLYTMNMKEVITDVLQCKKIHLISICFTLPVALLLVGWLIYDNMTNNPQFDEWFVYGVIFGAVTGLAIGSWQLVKFLKDYRIFLRE